MKKRTIVICDDEESRRENWKRRLESLPSVRGSFTVQGMSNGELLDAVGALEKRRSEARGRGATGPLRGGRFDDVDILAIDYDLLKLDARVFLTGEAIAYLVRCYSACGLIIALNQYGDNVFDLTLSGHPESYADLNIGGSQLDNTGLWQEPWRGFRPWSWPLLPEAVKGFESRVSELRARLDEPVLEFLGFHDEGGSALPRNAIEFIDRRRRGRTGTAPKTTFREFVTQSGNGLRGKDKPFSEDAVARIAAARLWKWLERLVLPGQDVIVDAPHLVSRYPSLLRGQAGKVETWNKVASLRRGIKALRHEIVDPHRFRREHWLSRAGWFWQEVSKLGKISEVARPWSDAPTKSGEWVFCEDLSRFLPRSAVREFVAELPSPFVRRFVADAASSVVRRTASTVRNIKYRPEVRFSL